MVGVILRDWTVDVAAIGSGMYRCQSPYTWNGRGIAIGLADRSIDTRVVLQKSGTALKIDTYTTQ